MPNEYSRFSFVGYLADHQSDLEVRDGTGVLDVRRFPPADGNWAPFFQLHMLTYTNGGGTTEYWQEVDDALTDSVEVYCNLYGFDQAQRASAYFNFHLDSGSYQYGDNAEGGVGLTGTKTDGEGLLSDSVTFQRDVKYGFNHGSGDQRYDNHAYSGHADATTYGFVQPYTIGTNLWNKLNWLQEMMCYDEYSVAQGSNTYPWQLISDTSTYWATDIRDQDYDNEYGVEWRSWSVKDNPANYAVTLMPTSAAIPMNCVPQSPQFGGKTVAGQWFVAEIGARDNPNVKWDTERVWDGSWGVPYRQQTWGVYPDGANRSAFVASFEGRVWAGVDVSAGLDSFDPATDIAWGCYTVKDGSDYKSEFWANGTRYLAWNDNGTGYNTDISGYYWSFNMASRGAAAWDDHYQWWRSIDRAPHFSNFGNLTIDAQDPDSTNTDFEAFLDVGVSFTYEHPLLVSRAPLEQFVDDPEDPLWEFWLIPMQGVKDVIACKYTVSQQVDFSMEPGGFCYGQIDSTTINPFWQEHLKTKETDGETGKDLRFGPVTSAAPYNSETVLAPVRRTTVHPRLL